MKSKLTHISKRALAIILSVLMMISVLGIGTLITADAATLNGGQILFLNTTKTLTSNYGNTKWNQGGARFAAYFMDSSKSTTEWVSMTASPTTGYYYVTVPSTHVWSYVIFCRMDASKPTNDWPNKWDQTKDLTLSTTNNLCTPEGWGTCEGTWGTYQVTSTASLSADSESTTANTAVTLTPSLSSNTNYNDLESTSYSVTGSDISADDYDISGNTFTPKKAGTYNITATVTYNAKGFTSITKTATASKTITVADNPTETETSATTESTEETTVTETSTATETSTNTEATETTTVTEETSTATETSTSTEATETTTVTEEVPTTVAPTTAAPTTAAPTTAAPTTAAPTTAAPTTAAPTTAAPTTAAPTTVAPTTAAPTLKGTYYLVGYIEKNNYTGNNYKFNSDGTLTVNFKEDSYVYVKNASGTNYMTKSFDSTAKEGDLYPTSNGGKEKLHAGSGEITFNLKENADGSLHLSFTKVEQTYPTGENTQYTFYFIPLQADENAGCSYYINFGMDDGDNTWQHIKFTKTNIKQDGRYLYKATVTSNITAAFKNLQYQVYDSTGQTWKHQIAYSNVTLSSYNNKVVVATSDNAGKLEDYKPDEQPSGTTGSTETTTAVETSTSTEETTTASETTTSTEETTTASETTTSTEETTTASETSTSTEETTTATEETTVALKDTYYLVGYIDNNDYTGTDYKFNSDGTLTVNFKEDSYVYVKNASGTNYMTKGYPGDDAKESDLYVDGDDKLHAGSGEITFTLKENADGSLHLSFTKVEPTYPTGEDKEYTFYYIPLQEDEDAGCTFYINFGMDSGDSTWQHVQFIQTEEKQNGRYLYKATVTSNVTEAFKCLQYQVYDSTGETWEHQIEYTNAYLSDYDNKVVVATSESTGDIEDYNPDVEEPTTVAPTTAESTTVAPTTVAPTTVAPTTVAPTTVAPTTVAPTTIAPTTVAPTTVAPTTVAPTTVAPTTVAPTTVAPTTEVPTTVAPTTVAPKPKPTQPPTVKPAKDLGPGADEKAVDAAIKKLKNDKDPKGSKFGGLKAKAAKTTKTSITVSWTKVKGAKKYIVYSNKCGKTKGKINAYKLIKTTTAKSIKLTKINGKKISKGTYYKFLIVAVNSKGKVVSTSKTIHVATKGTKVTNYKSIKLNASSKTLKKGKTFKVKVTSKTKQVKKASVKNHRSFKYESSNTKIATVSSKGKIKAKKKGTCYVYVYAQNGVYKRIKIKVK